MNDPQSDPSRASGSRAISWPQTFVLLTVLMTYGFELFNFNVSADEPLYWNAARADMAQVWGWQGRWGMGLTAFLLPSTDVPVVPLALGLAAAVTGLWWLARSICGLREWEAAFAVSLAIGLPTLAFHFSFTINALGLGLGFLACTTSGVLTMQGGWPRRAGAVLSGAYAIGVYEGFAFVLVAVLLAVIWRRTTWTTAVTTAVTAIGSALVWFVLGRISSASVPPEHAGYVKDILSLDDILGDPLGRLSYAITRTLGMVLERPLYFGYTNPLPALLVAVVAVTSAWTVWKRPRRERLLSGLVLVALLMIPLVAAFSTRVLFQRSLVYLPVIVVVILGFGLPVVRRYGRSILGVGALAVAVMAIAGNATIANGAFFSGTVTTDEDILIASNIASSYRSMSGDFETPLPTVVAPRSVEAARPDSWAGRSTFELGVMNTQRTAVAFLRMRGVDVLEPSIDDQERGATILADMPSYPSPGFLQVRDGLLLINLTSAPGR